VINTLVRVQHLIEPGSALLRPTMVAKVLRAARHARKAGLVPSTPTAATANPTTLAK
jgi:hypothetical protein